MPVFAEPWKMDMAVGIQVPLTDTLINEYDKKTVYKPLIR